MLIINYFIFAAFLIKTIVSHPDFTYDEKPDHDCIKRIAEKYFTEKHINIFLDSKYKETWQNDIIRSLNSWTVEIYNEDVSMDNEIDIHMIKSKVTFIILNGAEDARIVRRLRAFKRNFIWNSRSKILVLIKESNQVRLVLRTLWNIARAVNVVVMLDCHQFYTWKPYQKEDCNEVKKISKITFSQLFLPKDYSNLHGCNITIQSTYIPPYVLQWDRNTFQYTDGIEIRIMKSLADLVNMTLVYLPNRVGFHAWITRHTNGTIGGALRSLMRYRADIAFSCLRLNYERFMLADGLVSHLEDEIVWFVPTPRPKAQVATMMYALHKYIWAGIAACIFMSSILLYFKEKSPSFINLILKMTAAFLNIPVRTKTRLPVFLAYVTALHTITSYNSWMSVNLMREMTDKPITTLQDIADKNLIVYLLPSLTHYYNKSDFSAWEKILQPGRFVYNEFFFFQLEEIAHQKTAALLFPKLPALYYIGNNLLDENGLPKVNYLKQRFLSSKLTFYLAPGHPLTPFLNYKMMQLVESGLINFWVRSYVNHTLSTTKSINYHDGSKALTIKNMSAGLYYYNTLLVFSGFIFLCELVFGFVKKRMSIHQTKLFEKEFQYVKKNKLKSWEQNIFKAVKK